jgi:hypothetical protein
MKKKIILPGWMLDNAGTYHAPGTEVTVDDDGSDGCITVAQADQLAQLDAQRAAARKALAAPAPAPASDEA